MKIVIVTGMSGAGKSSVLNIFEDMGYYCMDNLPPQLMPNFVDLARGAQQGIENVAIGVDIRGGHFFESLTGSVEALRQMRTHVSILYLEASDEVLIRRYKEGRRPHPMDKAGNIYDGIQRERAYLRDIRKIADVIIDTSVFNLGQLKSAVEDRYLGDGEERKLMITVTSFGFKYGIQLDADLVFDARFVPNPYYLPDLRPKTGLDEDVANYIFSFGEAVEFVDRLDKLLQFLIPLYKREGKRTLVIGIGCTGGRHRSVAIAEALAERLEKSGKQVSVVHRDRGYWTR